MNGRAWTRDDTQTLTRLLKGGHGDEAIGEHMNRHPKYIGQKRRELGLDRGISAQLSAMMARINTRRRMRRA